MNRSLKTLILVICIFSFKSSTAQELKRPAIAVVARPDTAAITLRWAPSTPALWQETRSAGYIIERAEIDTLNQLVEGSGRRLTQTPIRPWPLDEWKRHASKDNRYAAIAAQMMYGKSFKATATTNEFAALQNAANEQASRFSFALFSADNDTLAAAGQGLRYVDREVEAGKLYLYRIFPAGANVVSDTGFASASLGSFLKEQALIKVATTPGDGVIQLEWQQLGQKGYSGYIVRRSEDNGKTYKRLNANPLVSVSSDTATRGLLVYTDSTITNYKKYRYAITGITPFAEETYPVEVGASGRDLTPPPAPRIEKPVQVGRGFKITWSMPQGARDLAGFDVYRSSEPKANFHSLINTSEDGTLLKTIPPQTFEFTDEAASEEETFYTVEAVDTAGNRSMSIAVMGVFVDPLPPPAPENLRGTIDTNGIVVLTWNDVPLSRVKGFRVLRANDATHEFGEVSRGILDDTTFTDTISIRTLTRYVYYKVTSVDYNYRQGISPMLSLLRPDIVVPAAPLITDVSVSDTAVRISWNLSPSEDIRSQRIERRRDSSAWSAIATLTATVSQYSDADVIAGTDYQYRIIAIDSSGFESEPSLEVAAQPYGVLKTARITANYDNSGKIVRLSWQAPVLKEARAQRTIIYRAFADEPLSQLTAISEDQSEFNDKEIAAPGRYRYAIRIIAEGLQSDVSEEVSVEVR